MAASKYHSYPWMQPCARSEAFTHMATSFRISFSYCEQSSSILFHSSLSVLLPDILPKTISSSDISRAAQIDTSIDDVFHIRYPASFHYLDSLSVCTDAQIKNGYLSHRSLASFGMLLKSEITSSTVRSFFCPVLYWTRYTL